MTYDERLVEREHNDELDRQKLRERTSALQLFLSEAIEQEQTVQRDAIEDD